MKRTRNHRNLVFASAVAGVFAACAANAQMAPPLDGLDVNLFSLGVGSVPDYIGSSHNETTPAVAARYEFTGSDRYVVLLGTTLQANLINDRTWRAGPLLNYRDKRDDKVQDPVVSQMTEIDAKIEAGAFLQYNMKLSEKRMHQMVFSTDLAASSYGTVGHLRMMYWQPFSETLVGNVGVGMTYANNKWTDTYFGVFGAQNIALYPVALAGKAYNPGSDVTGITIPFGMSKILSREWMVSAGARYEKLQGDARDSPVVALHGDSTQWIYGMAISYLF